MKKLFLIVTACFVINITNAQTNCSLLSKPSQLGVAQSTFRGDPKDNIPLNTPACNAFGKIPAIIDDNILPLWYTYHMAYYHFSKVKPQNPLSFNKEHYDTNVKIQETMAKQLKEEFKKIENASIPTYAPSHLGIKINSPFKIKRIDGLPIGLLSAYDKAVYGFELKASLDVNNGRDLLRFIDYSAIFISHDNYVYCAESIVDNSDGATIYFQLDEKSAYVINNIAKIIIVEKNGKTINEAWKWQNTLYNAYKNSLEECKKKYTAEQKKPKLEPECFKFISVAHELLASKYSQDPPVFKKYGIGPCKHTPKHRGAGSVGIDKTWSSICFEDNHSIDVRIYKDISTGGIETVIFGQVSELSGKRVELYHHICDLEGDLRRALYSYKGKAKSSLSRSFVVDLYSNGNYNVEIGKNRSFIAFNKIKNTNQKTTPETTPQKKPEKRPYIKKTWPQGSKPGRIRKSPNNNTIETGQINPGDTIVIIDEQNGWSQVDLGNGTTGWIENEEVNNPDNSATQQKTTHEGGTSSTYDSLEDFDYLHELLHLKDFKKIHTKLESDGWKPTEPKDDYVGDFYLGKKFSATSPKTKNSITISKESKKKPNILLHLKKSSFEKVKEKAIVQNFSFDEEKTKRLSPSNSKDKSYYFQHPDGCIIHYKMMEIPPRSFVSFSIQ